MLGLDIESEDLDSDDRCKVDDDKLDSELVLLGEERERRGDNNGEVVGASSEGSSGIGPSRAC